MKLRMYLLAGASELVLVRKYKQTTEPIRTKTQTNETNCSSVPWPSRASRTWSFGSSDSGSSISKSFPQRGGDNLWRLSVRPVQACSVQSVQCLKFLNSRVRGRGVWGCLRCGDTDRGLLFTLGPRQVSGANLGKSSGGTAQEMTGTWLQRSVHTKRKVSFLSWLLVVFKFGQCVLVSTIYDAMHHSDVPLCWSIICSVLILHT